MNKTLKMLLKVSLGLCLMGVLLCVIGVFSGANITDVINSDTLDPDYDPDYVDESGTFDWFDWDDSMTIQTTAPSKKVTFDGFSNIKAELEVTELSIEDGEEYSLTIVEGVGRSFSYKTEGSTLLLKENEEDHKIQNQTSSRVIITVPKDAYLDQVAIKQGVGAVSIYDLMLHELEINSGIGNTDLKRISTNELTINGGVGNIEGDDLEVFDEMDINSGVGTVSLKGDFCGEIDLDSGMGNVEIHFKKPEYNYHFDIDNGLGTVSINGEKYKAGEFSHGSDQSVYDIDIDNGTGNMELTFEE